MAKYITRTETGYNVTYTYFNGETLDTDTIVIQADISKDEDSGLKALKKLLDTSNRIIVKVNSVEKLEGNIRYMRLEDWLKYSKTEKY